jgi:hypothetical protein
MTKTNIIEAAIRQRTAFFEPFIKQIIFDFILATLFEAGLTTTNQNADTIEALRRDLAVDYNGKKHYFVDARAITDAVNSPKRFAGQNNINMAKAIKDMDWESLTVLDPYNNIHSLVNWGLFDEVENHNLNTLIASSKYVFKQFNNQQLAFKTSGWTDYFVRVQVTDPDNLGANIAKEAIRNRPELRGYELVYIGKTEEESSVYAGQIDLNPTGQFDGSFRRAFLDPITNLIKSNLRFASAVEGGNVYQYDSGDIPQELRDLYDKMIPVVLEEIRMSLKDEQMTRDALEAIGPRGGDYGDVLRPEQAAPRPVPRPAPITKKINALKPADFQCYLLQDIRALSAYKDAETLREPYKRMGFVYDNSNTKGEPGNLISYINHANKTREVDALLNLCPDVYALLTPYIKLYRVDYVDDDKLVPSKEQEIPFPNFIDPKDINRITNGTYGRYPGAGIKSFSWALDGVNPAEVTNNISAQLNLRFQTVQDLFSLNESLSAGQDQAGYLDLIIGSPTSFKDKPVDPPPANSRLPSLSTACFEAESQAYDATSYRIKVVAGWSTPPDFESIVKKISSNSSKDPNFAKNLQQAIDRSRVALYLQNTTHELTFNENGAVDLAVNYQASLSGILRTPQADIFVGGTEYDAVMKSLNKDLKAENQKLSQILKQTAGANASGTNLDLNNPEIQQINNKKEKILEDLMEIKNKSRSFKYKRFLSRLYDTGKIQWYNVPYENLTLYKDMTKEQKLKFFRSQQKSDRLGDKPSALDPATADVQRIQELTELQNFLTQNESMSDSELSSLQNKAGTKLTFGEAREKVKKELRTLYRKKSDGALRVPFFYLGDFLEEILHYMDSMIVDENGKNGSFQFLTAMVELIDPQLAFRIKSVDIRCPNNADEVITRTLGEIDPMRFRGLNSIKFRTNIASIPISLEFFQEWFVNTVVRPQKEIFTFLNFVKSISSSLIAQSFNSICFEDGVNFNLRFDTAPFNLGRSFVGKTTTADELANAKEVADRKAVSQLLPEMPFPVVPSLILYSVDSRPQTGLYDEDLSNGIYHYYLGASCGLVKNMTFERQNIPYYREGRLQRTSALSAVQLRELYHANLSLIGNTIHRNGQYVFINPMAIGAGSTTSRGDLPNYARLLGIGGYYMIVKVEHVITAEGFNVSIRALQEGVDFSSLGNSTVNIVTVDGNVFTSPTEKP